MGKRILLSVFLIFILLPPMITTGENQSQVTSLSSNSEKFKKGLNYVSTACNYAENALELINVVSDRVKSIGNSDTSLLQIDQVIVESANKSHLEFESKFFEYLGKVKLTIHNEYTEISNFTILFQSPSPFMTMFVADSEETLYSLNRSVVINPESDASIWLYFRPRSNSYNRLLGLLSEFNYTIYLGDISNNVIYEQSVSSTISWLHTNSRLNNIESYFEQDGSNAYINYTWTPKGDRMYMDVYINNKVQKELIVNISSGDYYYFNVSEIVIPIGEDLRFRLSMTPIIPYGVKGMAFFDDFEFIIDGTQIFSNLFTHYGNVAERPLIDVVDFSIQVYEEEGNLKELQVAVGYNFIDKIDDKLLPIIEGMELGLIVDAVENQFQPLVNVAKDLKDGSFDQLDGEPWYVWLCFGADVITSILNIMNPFLFIQNVAIDYLSMKFAPQIDNTWSKIKNLIGIEVNPSNSSSAKYYGFMIILMCPIIVYLRKKNKVVHYHSE